MENHALQIAGAPSPAHTPQQRMIAWAILKAARGQTVRQVQLQGMARRTPQVAA